MATPTTSKSQWVGSVDIPPMPCPRPRVMVRGKFAHAYHPAAYRKWREEFKRMVGPQLDGVHFERPVRVDATFTIERPRTTKLLTPKGDIDNYVKSLLDGLTDTGVWGDDKLVARLNVAKVFGSPAGIDIIIEEIP